MAKDNSSKESTGPKEKPKKPLILKQKPMVQVVYALVPLALASVYFFGWRSLVILAVVNLAGFLTEYIVTKIYGQQVSSAVFVTNFLFALSLPVTIPLWIAVVGIVFGVLFGKMVFGGFGKNVFNPAISGRAFIYVSFGVPMTSRWVKPAFGGAGGFSMWQADAVASATPLASMATGEQTEILPLLFGNISGSLGETSAILILICGGYLLLKKVANRNIVISGFAGYLLFQLLFWSIGAAGTLDPVRGVLSGSFLYVIMFMATDPISAGQTTNGGRIIYGFSIGALTALIRTFSSWPEGATFAILLANMFAPLLDDRMKLLKKKLKEKKKKAQKKAAAAEGQPA